MDIIYSAVVHESVSVYIQIYIYIYTKYAGTYPYIN